ncbi:MAG TPA: hypothetical protein PL007_03340 [Thermomonas sp.]|jgi:hypothetical protein|nr:hypothetical protein [Thermomonas sp.]HQY49379.1 hypothetical protein [Thermomonas sp.]HRA56198.1 hypothetical protein [Thermomonas sp.]
MPLHRHIVSSTFAIALSGVMAMAAAQTKPPTEKKIYCWNDAGRKICGDALPASATDSARTEFSIKSGMATAHVDRTLNQEERSAAAQAADLARQQAEAEAMQKRRDLAMVESYMTEADLRRAYGERTALLDESIKSSRLTVSTLRSSLISLLRQAGNKELSNTPVPKPLADSIQTQHADLLRQGQILLAQQQDRSELGSEFEDSLRRYRLMKPTKAEPSAATPAATPSAAPAPAKPPAG